MLTRLLLVLFLVLLVLWWARSRRRDKVDPPAPKPTRELPLAIVPCAHCGVHLPRRDALPGPGGALYCSEAHRREAGDATR